MSLRLRWANKGRQKSLVSDHNKTNKMTCQAVRPAKTRISLDLPSLSSLCRVLYGWLRTRTFFKRKVKNDHTGWMLKLIWGFAGSTGHFVDSITWWWSTQSCWEFFWDLWWRCSSSQRRITSLIYIVFYSPTGSWKTEENYFSHLYSVTSLVYVVFYSLTGSWKTEENYFSHLYNVL